MVGLLIITHSGFGETLLKTATTVLGNCPMATAVISVGTDSDPDDILQQAEQKMAQFNQEDGIIVLTDMYGATPCNIALQLDGEKCPLAVIAGVNLPMLVRLLNYPQLSLLQLIDKALSGGHDGIFLCTSG